MHLFVVKVKARKVQPTSLRNLALLFYINHLYKSTKLQTHSSDLFHSEWFFQSKGTSVSSLKG